jgi:hypothetical protein
MANKNFSDVRPNRDDKDSSKEGMKSSAKQKPANPGAGSFKAASGKPVPCAMSGKGGKDLPAVKVDEYSNRSDEATGELP